MKLKQYLDHITKLINEHPEALECEMIYAQDDEGNGYQKVDHIPSICYTPEIKKYYIEEVYFEKEDYKKPNAVCIN